MITINATGDTTIHTAGKYCPEDILVKVPSSGSSGGGSVETCSVTIVNEVDEGWVGQGRLEIFATVVDADGTLIPYHIELDLGSVAIQNIVCDVALVIISLGTCTASTCAATDSIFVIEHKYVDNEAYPCWLLKTNGDGTVTFA